jgi:hypothetical protein
MSVSLTSVTIDIAELPGYAVHAIWTGSPVGTINVNASNDSVNFVSVASQAAGGSNGQFLLNTEVAHYRWLQVTYTATSGTGSLTTYVSAKRS